MERKKKKIFSKRCKAKIVRMNFKERERERERVRERERDSS